MRVTRRQFVRGGVSAFTIGFAAPSVLSEVARAQGASGRHLVVLYLGGGNDALSFLVPYTDGGYYARRPTQAVPADRVIQIGSDVRGKPLGLHPNLPGLGTMFEDGNVAIIQRTGYANSSRSHFRGTDIWSTANPGAAQGPGWMGRYLDTLPSPVDPLVAWNTSGQLPHTLQSASVGIPSIPDPVAYAFTSPNLGVEATYSATAAQEMSSHLPASNPHLSFVNSTTQDALATLDRVELVARYAPGVAYPDNGFGQALRAVAGAMVEQLGTHVFWVQTGGFDTHASQNTITGRYADLMTSLNDGLLGLLHGSPQPGSARRRPGPGVLRVWPSSQRERQQRDGPWGGWFDDGDRRTSRRWSLWDGADACRHSRQPNSRERRSRRFTRNGLSVRLRARDRRLARLQLGVGAGR